MARARLSHVFAAVLLAALTGSPVAAHAGAHDRGLVILLSKIHGDPTPAELAHFGPDLSTKLESIATDPSVIRLARVRAIACLGRSKSDAAFALARQFATDPKGEYRLRVAAVWTLGHDFPARPETLTILQTVLRASDPGLRTAAVRALSRIGSPAALRMLSLQRVGEQDLEVRAALRRAATKTLPAGTVLPREGRRIRPVLSVHTPSGGAR